jgi:hypothetical protein
MITYNLLTQFQRKSAMQHITPSPSRQRQDAPESERQPRPDRAAAMKSAHEALSHNDWLREKLARAAQDERPRVPHEQVMKAAQAIIDRKRIAHDKDALA